MLKILIVDDQAEIRELLRLTLQLAQSFEILEAQSAQQAIELVREQGPDLVLLDIMMPGELDGLSACAAIKQLPGRSATRVILVSSKPFAEIESEFRRVGADLFLPKPFGPSQLVQGIASLYQRPV